MPSLPSLLDLAYGQFHTPSGETTRDELGFLRAIEPKFQLLWIILYPFLVCDVLLDDFQRRHRHSRDKIGIGPEVGRRDLSQGYSWRRA